MSPAAIVGILFDDWIDEVFYNAYVVAGALIVYGILFIIVENWNKGRKPAITSVTEIGYDTALIIGIFQLLAAVVPGTSRSGATIIGALLLGVARGAAAEFTFYLAIPVMFGASVLKIIKSGLSFGAMGYVTLLVGMLVAFVVSLFVIRYLMSYIRKHDFKAFGYLLNCVRCCCPCLLLPIQIKGFEEDQGNSEDQHKWHKQIHMVYRLRGRRRLHLRDKPVQ